MNDNYQLVGLKSSKAEKDFSVAGENLVDKGKPWKKWSIEFDDTAKIKLNGQELVVRKGRILSFEYDYECNSLEFLEAGKSYYFFAGY